MPFPRVSETERQLGLYPKWDGNTAFEREALKAVRLPEDYHPTEEEAWRIMQAALED